VGRPGQSLHANHRHAAWYGAFYQPAFVGIRRGTARRCNTPRTRKSQYQGKRGPRSERAEEEERHVESDVRRVDVA